MRNSSFVRCPKCHAPRGVDCHYVVEGYRQFYTKGNHPERIKLAHKMKMAAKPKKLGRIKP